MRFLVPFLAPAISTLTASITTSEAAATLTATAAELEVAGANIVQSITVTVLLTWTQVVSSLLTLPSVSRGANHIPASSPRILSFVLVILTPLPLRRLRSSFWLKVLMILSITGLESAMMTLSTLRDCLRLSEHESLG